METDVQGEQAEVVSADNKTGDKETEKSDETPKDASVEGEKEVFLWQLIISCRPLLVCHVVYPNIQFLV